MVLQRLVTGLAPYLYLVLLFQLSCVLSLFHSGIELHKNFCSIPIHINGSNSTGSRFCVACSTDYSSCDVKGLVNFSIEKYSYDGAVSTIHTHVNLSTDDESTSYYYTLCLANSDSDNAKLLECFAKNKSQFDTQVQWKVTGKYIVSLAVYNRSNKSLDCATRNILVANNSLSDEWLNVTVTQPKLEDIITPTQPSGFDPVMPIGPGSPFGPNCDNFVPSTKYVVGNLTFTTAVNITNYTTSFFSYDFGDSSHSISRTKKNQISHRYKKEGSYNYTVHAIVVLKEGSEAIHTSSQDNIIVKEELTQPHLQVGKDDSVHLGVSRVQLKIKGGSFPVKFCWCMVFHNSTMCTKMPYANSSINGDSFICKRVDSASAADHLRYELNFTTAGLHHILFNISNSASCLNLSYAVSVTEPPTPPTTVIVSSAAVGVLAALLAFTIIVIIVIVTVVIPYRRYRNRMTETANFRFIELTDSTSIGGKMRRSANSLVNIFRSNRDSKVGLVNTDQEFTGSDKLYGPNQRVVPFATYDSL